MSLLSLHPVVEVSRDSTMTTRVAAPIYDPLLSPGQRGRCGRVALRKHESPALLQVSVIVFISKLLGSSCAEAAEGISAQHTLLFAAGELWFFWFLKARSAEQPSVSHRAWKWLFAHLIHTLCPPAG